MSGARPLAILFANLKGNIGDFAILEAVLRDVSRHHPDRELHVFPHAFTSVDQTRLEAFRASGAPQFEIVGTTWRSDLPAWAKRRHRRLFDLGLWPHAQGFLISRRAAAVRDAAHRFAEYEAIFVAGGDQWNGFDSGISMFATLCAVSNANGNIFAYPFSLNPDVAKFNKLSALRSYLGKIRTPLIVRDSISLAQCQRIGVAAELGADCVFTLQDIAQRITPHPDRDSARTIISLARSPARDWFPSMRDALARLVPESGPLELLTTCAPEDLEAYRSLGAEFGIPVRAPSTWQEAVAEFGCSALTVTDRLHGLILASFTRCPLLPVTDRKKSEAFAKDAGMPHYAASMAELTPALLARARASSSEITAKVAAYRVRSREMSCSPIRS